MMKYIFTTRRVLKNSASKNDVMMTVLYSISPNAIIKVFYALNSG